MFQKWQKESSGAEMTEEEWPEMEMTWSMIARLEDQGVLGAMAVCGETVVLEDQVEHSQSSGERSVITVRQAGSCSSKETKALPQSPLQRGPGAGALDRGGGEGLLRTVRHLHPQLEGGGAVGLDRVQPEMI